MIENTDYRKEYLNTVELLPEIFHTDANISILNNGINRLLTKPDNIRTSGTIGKQSKDVKRIEEDSIHRQSYQLQPLIYSEDNISSFKDLLTKLRLICGDEIIDRQDNWGECEQFDFAPPINLDKFIKYKDYYWTGDSEPDYFTIHNPINLIDSKITEYKSLNKDTTDLYDIKTELTNHINGIMKPLVWSTNTIASQYFWINSNKWIHKSDLTGSTIAIQAKLPILEYRDTIEVNEWLYTKQNWLYKNSKTLLWEPSENGPTNEELFLRYPIIDLTINTITIEGNHEEFVKDFKFYVTGTKNNNHSFTVQDSSYDNMLDHTIINVSYVKYDDGKNVYKQPFDTIRMFGTASIDQFDNYGSIGEYYGFVVPFSKTSKGDDWNGLHNHWRWLSNDISKPVNHQHPLEQKYYVETIKNYGFGIEYDQDVGFDGKNRFNLPIDYVYDTDDLQVYINGIRQYGTYQEAIKQNKGQFDILPLGYDRLDIPLKPNDVLTNCIDFLIPLKVGDTILIKVGPSCILDKNRHYVPIYSNYDNGIVYKNLMEYRFHEQVKMKINQYINFDIYNVFKNTNYMANPIFKYKEDVNVLISQPLQQKTPIYQNNFTFENLLTDDNKLFCYNDGAWFTTDNLYTVWRKCSQNYKPKKVNIYQEASTIDSDWEIHKPFLHNLNNECRVEILYNELRQHFGTILTNQTSDIIGISGKNIAKTKINYDYVGGNIQIFNNRFNLLVAALHQNVVGIETILNSAKTQYQQQLESIKTESIKSFPNLISNVQNLPNTAFVKYLEDGIYYDVMNNIQNAMVFSDSTSIKNFTPTLPTLGFKKASKPLRLINGINSRNPTIGDYKNIKKLRHHDGHLSNLNYSNIDYDAIIKSIIAKNITDDFIITKDSIRSSNMGLFKLENDILYRCNVDLINHWEDNNWDIVDFDEIYNSIIFKIENQLYEISIAPKFKYMDIIGTNPDDHLLFFNLLQKEYVKYAKYNNIPTIDNDFDITKAFTYNYLNAPDYLTINYQNSKSWGARWCEIYELQYNTPYPHLEPWRLQNFDNMPDGWDTYYKHNGYWKPEMWFNIRSGIVPIIFTKPSIVPKYSIISVNDSGNPIGRIENPETFYDIDALLPPYINHPNLKEHSLIVGDIISTKDINGNSIIQQPLIFENQNNYERLWRDSIHYNYAILLILFKMQPVKMMNYLFRDDIVNNNSSDFDGLIIDKSERILSNKEIKFHGSMINGVPYLSNSINQLYVQSLRSNNNGVIISKFIDSWNTWEQKLSYQTNSTINTAALNIDHDRIVISNDDYSPILKKSPNALEKWIHAIIISLNSAGKNFKYNHGLKVPADDAKDWIFRLDIKNIEHNSINYFDVKSYPIQSVDVINNTLTVQSKNIINWPDNVFVNINYNSNNLDPSYNYQIKNVKDNTFKLIKFDDFNQVYREIKLYDEIKCYEFVYDDKTSSLGTLSKLQSFKYTQLSGDIFPVLSSNSLVLLVNHNRLIENSDYTLENNKIFLLKFDKFEFNDVIEVYEIVTPTINDYDLKYDKSSNKLMQYRSLSNRWVSYSTNNEFLIPNVTNNIVITNNGINIAYTISGNKITLDNNIVINNLNIKIGIPNGINIEERISKFKALDNSEEWYHMAIDNNTIKKLSFPTIITGVQNVINILDGYAAYLENDGFIFNDYSTPIMDPIVPNRIISWELEIEKFIAKVYSGFNTKFDSNTQDTKIYDYIDINPFKYELWIQTNQGIVSNILKSEYSDILLYPNIYDQFGNPIVSTENLKIFRTDKLTHLTYPMKNSTQYIGGLRIFIDYYEHVIKFNDYTTNFNLLFDSFLGLWNDNIKIELYKHYESSKRPNIGGGFLANDTMIDNMESNTIGLMQIYDTYADTESKNYIDDARWLVGYDNSPNLKKLDNKSDFLFWKGMISNKGSLDCVKAYTSKGNFTDIVLDESWAYRISSYGNIIQPSEQYLKLKNSDVNKNLIMLCFDGSENEYTTINSSDITRWDHILNKSNGILELSISNSNRYIINNKVEHSKSNSIELSLMDFPYLVLENFAEDVNIYVELNYNQWYELEYPKTIIIPTNTDNIVDIFVGIHKLNYTIDSNSLIIQIATGNVITINYSHGTLELPLYATLEIPRYIMGCSMISAYHNGEPLNIIELDNTHIGIPSNVEYTSISIAFNRSKLLNNIHYELLKSDIVKFFIDGVDLIDVDIMNYDASNLKTNLFKKVVIQSLPYYHPALDIHQSSADSINYILSNDPADYGSQFWNSNELYKTWLNTKDLGYYYYHDAKIYEHVADRIALWGLTSEWSHIDCYTWVESSITPDLYTGDEKPYYVLYKRTKNTVDGFWSDWIVEENTYQIEYAFNYSIVDGIVTIPVSLSIVPNTDSWAIYVNEIRTIQKDSTIVDGILSTLVLSNIEEKDTIRIVRFKDDINANNISFYNTDSIGYKIDYPYNVVTSYDDFGLFKHYKYYFWVSNSINNYTGISAKALENNFIFNDNPYVIYQDLNKWILKNIDGYVEHNNPSLQIIKDSSINTVSKYVENYNEVHNEWQTIRELSMSKVPSDLWSKMVKSLIDLPAYDKVLYDITNNTKTRYGINDGQVFGDSDKLIKSLMDLLFSDDFDIPNKDSFLKKYNVYSTPLISTMLHDVYESFDAKYINKIFFTLLKDMMSYNNEIDGLFKTSIVSLTCNVSPKNYV